MKRNRISARKRISSDATELTRLAICLSESGGKLEKAFWEDQLSALIDKLLHEGAEEDLNASLDRLFDAHAAAHDALADLIESRVENHVFEYNNQEFDVLLFNIPILAWSRYSIPSGPIPKTILDTLKAHLSSTVFAPHAQIALTDYLFSPDQLPRTFVETWQLARTLGSAALENTYLQLDKNNLPETNPFLSDTRYLLGAISIPKTTAPFKWNSTENITREIATKEWIKLASPAIEPLLTGCAFQLLVADAYHAACRNADIASRPYSVKASVAFLQTALGKPADMLRAVIGGFHEKRLEEYRIGFGPRDSEAIFHGVVWPLVGSEDENTEVTSEIENHLREAGIKEIIVHDQRFPFEFCDDCGAPLYPNVEGETVHAELPDPESMPSQTLH